MCVGGGGGGGGGGESEGDEGRHQYSSILKLIFFQNTEVSVHKNC